MNKGKRIPASDNSIGNSGGTTEVTTITQWSMRRNLFRSGFCSPSKKTHPDARVARKTNTAMKRAVSFDPAPKPLSFFFFCDEDEAVEVSKEDVSRSLANRIFLMSPPCTEPKPVRTATAKHPPSGAGGMEEEEVEEEEEGVVPTCSLCIRIVVPLRSCVA